MTASENETRTGRGPRGTSAPPENRQPRVTNKDLRTLIRARLSAFYDAELRSAEHAIMVGYALRVAAIQVTLPGGARSAAIGGLLRERDARLQSLRTDIRQRKASQLRRELALLADAGKAARVARRLRFKRPNRPRHIRKELSPWRSKLAA